MDVVMNPSSPTTLAFPSYIELRSFVVRFLIQVVLPSLVV